MVDESEYILLIRERYEKDEMSFEEENDFLWLINAPEQYENEKEMLAFAKKHPVATMKDLLTFWDSITPDGLAPGDDGADLIGNE